MWPATLLGRRSVSNCPHDNVEVTSIAGIQRRLCVGCGKVSLSSSSETPDEQRQKEPVAIG